MKTSASHIAIGRETLARRTRVKWWLIFHVRWIMGRGSRDGRKRYAGASPVANVTWSLTCDASMFEPWPSAVTVDPDSIAARRVSE